jgi:hypothetical protein
VLQVHHLPNERASSSAQWYNVFLYATSSKVTLKSNIKATTVNFLFVFALNVMQNHCPAAKRYTF